MIEHLEAALALADETQDYEWVATAQTRSVHLPTSGEARLRK